MGLTQRQAASDASRPPSSTAESSSRSTASRSTQPGSTPTMPQKQLSPRPAVRIGRALVGLIGRRRVGRLHRTRAHEPLLAQDADPAGARGRVRAARLDASEHDEHADEKDEDVEDGAARGERCAERGASVVAEPVGDVLGSVAQLGDGRLLVDPPDAEQQHREARQNGERARREGPQRAQRTPRTVRARPAAVAAAGRGRRRRLSPHHV
eukprot:7376193-Prymnesium_polylepis.1